MIHIIQIMSHPPAYGSYGKINPIIEWHNNKGQKIALWGDEWGNIIGNRLIECCKNKIKFEVWQPDYRANKVYSYTFKNGLTHKLFPAKKVFSKITLFGGRKELFSKDMEIHLNKMSNYENILIHTFFNARYNIRYLLCKFYKKTPFLFQFATNTEFHPYYGINRVKNVKNIVQNFVLGHFYNKVDYIFTSSNKTINNNINILKFFKHQGLSNIGLDSEKLKNIYTKNDSRSLLKINQEKYIIFSSQRIVKEKQIDKLIISFSKLNLNNYQLFISGDGDDNYILYLKQLVKNHNLEDEVLFTSYLSEKTLKLYYSASDLFISTSQSEAGPDSLYKAIFYDLPIITTDTGIGYEFLKDNDCGMYIDRNDSSLWHKAIENAYYKKNIKKPDRKIVDAFFSWKEISSYYYETFKYILKNFNK